MKKWILITAPGALLAVVAGGLAWSLGGGKALSDQSHGAIAACEAGLLRSLMSPSSYKRISAEFTAAGPLNPGEYRAYQETRGCPMPDTPGLTTAGCVDGNLYALAYGGKLDLERAGHRSPKQKQRDAATDGFVAELYSNYRQLPADAQATAYVEIQYDAANTFGAVVRSTTICRFGPRQRERYTAQDMFASVRN